MHLRYAGTGQARRMLAPRSQQSGIIACPRESTTGSLGMGPCRDERREVETSSEPGELVTHLSRLTGPLGRLYRLLERVSVDISSKAILYMCCIIVCAQVGSASRGNTRPGNSLRKYEDFLVVLMYFQGSTEYMTEWAFALSKSSR